MEACDKYFLSPSSTSLHAFRELELIFFLQGMYVKKLIMEQVISAGVIPQLVYNNKTTAGIDFRNIKTHT